MAAPSTRNIVPLLPTGAGAENVDLAPLTLTFSPQALDVVAGTVNLDLSPLTLVLSPQPLTPVSGVVNLDLAPITLALQPQALDPVSGVVNVDLSPVTLVLSPQPLDPQEGALGESVDLVPITLTFQPQALDVVAGVVNLDLAPITLTFAPQALEPTDPTYRFFPPVEITKPVGVENNLLLKGLHSRPIGLRLVNGLYEETFILVYERDILGKVEGVDYFYGGRRYTNISAAIAAILIASGYTPEVES